MSKKTKVEAKDEYKDKLPKGYEDTFEMSEAELEKLSAQINRDLSDAVVDKEPWIHQRLTDLNDYYGIRKPSDWPFKGAAKVSSQLHRVMVDTLVANIVQSANAPENIIASQTLKSQSIESAKYVQDLHTRLARNEYKLPLVLDRGLHSAAIESYVVLHPSYELDVCETVFSVIRWIPADIDPKTIKYDSNTDTVYGPNGETINSLDLARLPEDPEELKAAGLQEVRIDVTKEEVKEGIKVCAIPGSHIYVSISSPGETPFEKYQRAPFVIWEDYKTIQEMAEMQNYGKIKNYDRFSANLADNIAASELRETKEEQTGAFTVDDERQLVKNHWWYGKYEYKGKLRELCVYRNHDTGVILKVKVNQFGIRPFFPLVPFPVDETPFGESLPKQIHGLVTECELAINTVLNMGMIKAYPPKFYDPNSGFDPKTLGPIGPNAYIPVRDPSRNVFMPPQPEDPRILMEMVKLLMDLIERATANSDAVQGQISPTANTTAFEVQQSLVRAGVRFDIIYKRIKGQMEPMFSYIHKLVLRYMPFSKEVELMGQEGVITLEDGTQVSRLQTIHQQEGEFGLTLTGNSLAEEQMLAQKAEKLFVMMGQDPYLSFKPESPYYLRFNLIKHYNPHMMDKILPKPDEVAQLMRDRSTVQAEQEQKAVDEASQSNAEAQNMQMEMQLKIQEAQLKQAQAEQDLKMKEAEHEQKMRQMEETHRLKLELMREQANAKAKEAKQSDNNKKS